VLAASIGLLDEALALWRDCPPEAPDFGWTIPPAEQARREALFDEFLGSLHAELERIPRDRRSRAASHRRITEAFTQFARRALLLGDAEIELLLGGGLSSIGTRLAREARRFDPLVSTADIFQASRNAWTACGLQLLLGRRMALTPSIFAYSMLYPYTDNYLDSGEVPKEDKADFGRRFGARLSGAAVEPANGHESALWRLVAMIEDEYPRGAWPDVYEALAGIHRAQQNSLLLRRHGVHSGPEVERLCFAKGGVSVLADGYLAAGTLGDREARFIYSWGVLLQLADDLEDVAEDRRAGHVTVFSSQAAGETLDELTARTIGFCFRVMALMPEPPAAAAPLAALLRRSSLSLLIRSAGQSPDLYSPEFLAQLESHSPFRFSFLNERRRRFASREGMLARLFEAFLAGEEDEPAFPLLPGAFLPRC
jgi:hypothetical protein